MFPIENAVPTRYPPLATWGLIATNCIVFLFQISLSPDELGIFLTRFALIPAQYFTRGFDTGLPHPQAICRSSQTYFYMGDGCISS